MDPQDHAPAWKRGGRPRKHPPANIVDLVSQFALKNPTDKDLASKFGVDRETFKRWKSENANLQLAIDYARAQRIEALFEKIYAKAEKGDLKAAERWIQTFRPDLMKQAGTVDINISQTNIKVMPPPKSLDEFVKETSNMIESTAKEVETPTLTQRLFRNCDMQPGADTSIPSRGSK